MPTATKVREYLHAIGPGLITGASDDDPSGIATNAQAGSKYGLSFLWAALLTYPLMAAVQEICDRTALATGTGLGELAEQRFKRPGKWIVGALLSVLIVANTLNIAADLVAIGSGFNLLKFGPTWLWALLAGVLISVLLVKGTFARISLVFKVLAGALLAYIIVLVVVTHNWTHVAEHTFVPHIELNRNYLALLVAMLGTTISPYLFFWQSANRLEEMREEKAGGKKPATLKMRGKSRAETEVPDEQTRCVLRHGVLQYRDVLDHRRDRADASRASRHEYSERGASGPLAETVCGVPVQCDLRVGVHRQWAFGRAGIGRFRLGRPVRTLGQGFSIFARFAKRHCSTGW